MFQYSTPDKTYAELFDAVQSSHVCPDSKSFPDATPKVDPASILKSYRDSAHEDGFDLESFIKANFYFPNYYLYQITSVIAFIIWISIVIFYWRKKVPNISTKYET